MAKFIKKKINVVLLILLLISAFVPGILYLIWAAIPTKVPEKAPKNNGKLTRLIGSGLTLLAYIFAMIYFGMEEGLLAAILGLGAGFSALVFIPTLFSLKAKGTGIFTFIGILNIFPILITILFDVFTSFIFYLWLVIPMLVGSIITFVGVSNGKKQVLFEIYGDKEVEE